MLKIQNKSNPFSKAEAITVDFENKTLRQILSPYMAGDEFAYPTFVRVNGTPWLRDNWDNQVLDESEIEILAVVGEVVTVFTIINLVALAASLIFTAYGIYKANKAMRALRAGIGQRDTDPFFSVDGHANKANLNNPIEVAYGRNRMWPSYIGRPYRTYMDDRMGGWDNTSYVKNTNFVQIFCIGQGDFEIHAVQVGDIVLESYRGMRYEIVRPGESSKSLARIMYIQPDFEPTTLALDQSTDTFAMSPSGKPANYFEIDVEFPADGEYKLYIISNEVDLSTGAIIGGTESTMMLTRPLNSLDFGGTNESNAPPHRHTFSFKLGEASKRYAFRIHNDVTESQPINVLELRSFMSPTIPLGYADKTLLIVNYFVTQLSEDLAKDKINVIATRKLKTIQVSGSSRSEIVQPTKSIPWAIYDVLVNNVYGGGLPEEFIDLENFSEMHSELEQLNIGFNYIFNQMTTVADAVKVIAAAGRCALTYNGSRLVLIRDSGNSIPEAMFSSENIIPGSLSWATEMFDPTDPDAIEVSYVETDSGEEVTTIFTPENSLSNNVQKLTLQGVCNRTWAWREGAHRMRKTKLVRDTFKFKTGMEGYIPSIGATAVLSTEMEGSGTAGYVENYADGIVHLSRPVYVANSSILGYILFRRDDGSAMGPYAVTAASEETDDNRFKALTIGDIKFEMEFWRNNREPVHFIFNAVDTKVPIATKIQIENVTPSDDGTVEMTVTNFDQRVYEFDGSEAPADEYLPVNPTSVIPIVPWVKVDSVPVPLTSQDIPYTRIRWGSCFGATQYSVVVNGALKWSGTDTYLELPLLESSYTTIEVNAWNGTVEGNPTACIVRIGNYQSLENPIINSFEITENGLTLIWDNALDTEDYQVMFTLGTTPSANSPWYPTKANSLTYTKSMFINDFGKINGTSNDVSVVAKVRSVVNGVPTNASQAQLFIPYPKSPTSVVIDQDAQVVLDYRYKRHRTIKWAGDENALPGTKYHLYMQSYIYDINNPSNAVLAIRPWVRITTTDKFLFSSDLSVPQVEDAGKEIFPTANYTDPVYGDGCYATIFDADFIMDIGDKMDNALFVYDPTDYDANQACFTSGGFYPIIKVGGSQIDGMVWIANATKAFLTGKLASVVYPHVYPDGWLGHNYRVKGAIVADNGWFVPNPPTGVTTFDIDA